MVATWKELPIVDTVATLTDQAAHDTAATAAVGVATDAARHDHVHVIGSGSVDGSTIELNSGALRVKDGGISSAKLATLNAALNCGGQILTDAVLMASTIGSPPTAVVGKMFCDSSTKKVYVCTAV